MHQVGHLPRCIDRYVQYPLRTVPVTYSARYVEYPLCTVPVTYSTRYVQYPLCTVPVTYSTRYVQYPLRRVPVTYSTRYSCQILIKLKFSRQFSLKYTLISNFMKIRPLGAESFHKDRRADVQTDMTKLIIAFRHFANAPNISLTFCVSRLSYLQ